MCNDGSCGCNGQADYWPYDRALWTLPGAPAMQERVQAPMALAGILAGAWMRTEPNGIEGAENNLADAGLLNAATIARPYLAGPNVDTGFVPAVRGTLAEAQWVAQIKAVAANPNNQMGRP